MLEKMYRLLLSSHFQDPRIYQKAKFRLYSLGLSLHRHFQGLPKWKKLGSNSSNRRFLLDWREDQEPQQQEMSHFLWLSQLVWPQSLLWLRRSLLGLCKDIFCSAYDHSMLLREAGCLQHDHFLLHIHLETSFGGVRLPEFGHFGGLCCVFSHRLL